MPTLSYKLPISTYFNLLNNLSHTVLLIPSNFHTLPKANNWEGVKQIIWCQLSSVSNLISDPKVLATVLCDSLLALFYFQRATGCFNGHSSKTGTRMWKSLLRSHLCVLSGVGHEFKPWFLPFILGFENFPSSRGICCSKLSKTEIRTMWLKTQWLDADTGPRVCGMMDEMRQIHMDYRNPVEEKGWHSCSLSEREGWPCPLPWQTFIAFLGALHRGWSSFTMHRFAFSGYLLQKTKKRMFLITSKKKDICKCKGESGWTGYTCPWEV